MSKLYLKYLSLKKENSNRIYLFKSGIFYIFIDDDAKKISKILDLKLTNLNSSIQKCGFPVKSSDKYLNKLKNLNYEFEIISNENTSHNLINYIQNEKITNIIENFIKTNIDELSISQAFDVLTNLQNEFKDIINKTIPQK